MSDVDSTNITALKDNTSSMIDLSLSRIKSTHAKLADASPSKQDERKEGDESEEEFFDALDDEKDLQMVDALFKEKQPPQALKRASSFHGITEMIKEQSDESDHEERKASPTGQPALADLPRVPSRDTNNYFKEGSERNGPHDEEFFRVFGQFLKEAITKLKVD